MKLYALLLLACASLFGQANQNVIVQPDCVVSFTFVSTGNRQFDNRTGSCSTWTINYYATGFSGLSIIVETAPDNGGTPGSWSTFTAATGSNPNTSTASAQSTFGSTTSYFPWVRVRVSSITGTGKIVGSLFAYKLSAKSGSGGGGGGLTQAYTTVEQAGVAVTQRFLLNFVSGATCVDNAGTLATDCTISGGGGGSPNYQQSFTSATSVALTHSLDTTATLTQCYNSSNVEVIPNTTTITSVNVVTVTFLVPLTGYCNVNGGGGGGGGGVIYHYQYITAASATANGSTVVSAQANTPQALGATGTNGPLGGFTSIGLIQYPTGGSQAVFVTRIPSTWDGSAITFDADWTSNGGSGTITTTPYSTCLTTAGNVNTVSWNTGANVTATPGGGGGYFQGASALSIPLTGCSAGNLMYIGVVRQNGDTFASTVFLFGGNLGIKY